MRLCLVCLLIDVFIDKLFYDNLGSLYKCIPCCCIVLCRCVTVYFMTNHVGNTVAAPQSRAVFLNRYYAHFSQWYAREEWGRGKCEHILNV
jgi:hypothetical protein